MIRGYRGGYLPNERRAIESGLRDGTVRGVVATNALELGIDIGGLQAAVLCGYPGSIAATWQQMGRAGRTDEGALAILVATGGLLDQYVIQHPDYLFDRSPEHALINPDNLLLLIDHLRCAAFELPFQPDEAFGNCPFTADALQLLFEQGDVQQHGNRFFWSGESYPARRVSLRSTGGDLVTIQAEWLEDGGHSTAQEAVDIDFYGGPWADEGPVVLQQTVQVIGQIDRGSATFLLHEGAFYLHEGRSFYVRALDLAEQRATVTPTAVDYYTEVTAETAITVLATHDERTHRDVMIAHGELLVSSQVVGYRRVKHFTHENLGVFPLEYPPQTLETTGYWFSIMPALQEQLAEQGLWFDAVNDYGLNWQAQRQRVRARDGYRCTQCGRPEASGRQHDVHHLTPFRTFGYVAGLNENYRQANELGNLVLVCRTCHRRLEAGVRVRSGLDGLAYALTNIAP
ncbi:MAG: HNH endonuclease, partial [Caldilineaceae bacterium]|nr:HNH endonuclease [Caldilineaceae bacterium]